MPPHRARSRSEGLAVAGPDERAAGCAQARHPVDGLLHALVRHVAEYPAQQHERGGDRVRVVPYERRVPRHDRDAVAEPEPGRGGARLRRVARVEFDEVGADVGAARVRGEDAEQVVALPRAHARP
ncbi:hypothetical protein [Streptomyces sp. AM 3-1-1]|uniref:hypothetical protein n=1 Tax=Streptomyces sp. AM 3-1-1 TaxID=3028711 RepID=UPI0023B96ADE|nr:hypothetical protein [Streptomyces sp. AM 3-1-1]WEH28776.1 hypothetical protein P0D76_16340 [Streptomyces sp. AM 3-1-1]